MQIFFCPRHTDVKHPALLLDVLIQHRLLVGHHSLVHVDQIDVFVLKPLGGMQRGKRYALTLLFLALVQAFQFPGVILDVRKPSVIIFIASCAFLQFIQHIIKFIRPDTPVICILGTELVISDAFPDIVDGGKRIHPAKLHHIMLQRDDPLRHPRLFRLSEIPFPHIECHRVLVQ